MYFPSDILGNYLHNHHDVSQHQTGSIAETFHQKFLASIRSRKKCKGQDPTKFQDNQQTGRINYNNIYRRILYDFLATNWG